MPKKQIGQKEPVKLREKPLANGCKSLYLDIYRRGKRHKEYLRLYLIDAKTRAEKEQNRQTLETAQAIRARRQIELQNGEYSFTHQFKQDTPFLEYYDDMVEERRVSGRGTWTSWLGCRKFLSLYCDDRVTFRNVTTDFVQGFKNLLNTSGRDIQTNGAGKKYATGKPLSPNTKWCYFSCFRACINHAFNEQIIPYNPLRGVESFPLVEVERGYLTLDELQLLDAMPTKRTWLKRAFLFSCLTGLRVSDIQRLTWGDVQKQGEYTRIIFKQKKTGGQEYLDITPQTERYMGSRGEPEELVFSDFQNNSRTNAWLQNWVHEAGIDKRITFHCARHTFAIMMLDLGTDIYTVSKLLGHKKLLTTQIYAKVLDHKKQAAISLIPDIRKH